MQIRTLLIITLVFILLAACQTTTTPTLQPGEVQDIRVQIVEPVRSIARVEQFPLPNCGGTEKLTQSLGAYASASKSATLATKATTAGGGEAAVPATIKLKLEIQVELAYQQNFESANSRLDTLEMSAAPGTHVVYTVVWEGQVFNSSVQYSLDGKVYEVPYTYEMRVPKIDTSYNVTCSDNNGDDVPITNPTNPPNQSQFVSTPIPTFPPVQTPSPPNGINCSFMDELTNTGSVIMSIDMPVGSGNWAGAIVHLNNEINLPPGWIMQQQEGQEEVAGPAIIAGGTTATFWSPPICRPLAGPFVSQESCSFWNTLIASGNVVNLNYHEGVLSGANIRLVNFVNVPNGWTVDIGNERRYGPTAIGANTLVSFWSPVDCRPLSSP